MEKFTTMDFSNLKEFSVYFFQILNERNYEEIEKNLSENVSLDFPYKPVIQGRERVMIFLKALHRRYEYLLFDVKHVFNDTNNVCVIWENHGKTVLGEMYSNRGLTYIRLNDENKVEFLSDYFKNTVFPK